MINRENYIHTSRVDHNFTPKNRFFFRWFNQQHDNSTDFLGTITNVDLLDRTAWGLVADDVHIFNPGLLLNVRYGITYESNINRLGPNGIAFPTVQVDGAVYTALSNNGGTRGATNYSTAGATLTKISGRHSTRYGVEYRLQRETAFDYGFAAPQLLFAGTYTRGPLDNAAAAPIGQGMASMMFGIPSGGTINNNASSAQENSYWGLFVQDDWRVTSKLTINLGRRYEFEKPTSERYNRSIRGFDFATANPASPAQLKTVGGLLFAGVGSQPRQLWYADKNNFAPRVGMAYSLNGKTVIRTGYGVFFDVLGVDKVDVNQGGFNQPTNLIPSLDNGQTYVGALRNPFPNGIDPAPGASAGLATFVGRAVSFFNSKPLNPYNQRWSFSLQRQLPFGVVLDASYVGNPAFAGTGLANQTVAASQLLRPYPQFTSIQTTFPAGYSYYHSLQVNAEKRMSKGLSFQASWTYGKFMEAISYRNDTDSDLEKVISDLDYTHRFVLSSIYEFPFGRGRTWLNKMPFAAEAILGGWQLQGWCEGQTGEVLGFGNAIFNGDLHNIELPVSQRRAERWFNTDAGFNRNSAQVLANNIQTLSTRFNGVRADGINNFDVSLFKNLKIKERYNAQFRLENFNALNHVQFGGPNTTPINAAFGSITGEKGHGQRQITLGVKLLF